MLFATSCFAVNPGDAGNEWWRTYGTPMDQQTHPRYVSATPFTDTTFCWTMKNNCRTCEDYYGFDSHVPGLLKKDTPGYTPPDNFPPNYPQWLKDRAISNDMYTVMGHGFAPAGTNSAFAYVRMFNYGGGNAIYWGDASNTVCIGRGRFPSSHTGEVFTAKLLFAENEPIVGMIEAGLQAGMTNFHLEHQREVITHWNTYVDHIYTNGSGSLNTNRIYATTEYEWERGYIYSVEFHFDSGIYTY